MTTLNDLRDYCLGLRGATEDFPFDETTAVFRVRKKIFALMSMDQNPDSPRINLKCEPVLAEMLRETYATVEAGFHMSKRHWNTVTVDGSIPEFEVYEMIDHSYEQVVKSLTRKEREALETAGDV